VTDKGGKYLAQAWILGALELAQDRFGDMFLVFNNHSHSSAAAKLNRLAGYSSDSM
jgi:hypothetical protein